MEEHITTSSHARLGSPLVGRERELGELRSALEQTLSGHGQIVLLAGEPGIGKSRIAEELLPVARDQGALILWGRCQEWAGAPAYWPWVQILRRYLNTHDDELIRSDLGSTAADIAQIVPEIQHHIPDLAELPSMNPEQARFRLFDSLNAFFRRLSQRTPVVLVLDDLHWADEPSLLLVQFVAQDVHEWPLLLIGAYRNVELSRGHPLARTLAEINRDPDSRRIVLHGLREEDIAAYIRITAGREPPEGLAAAIHEETEGNAFFVTEVVRHLVSEDRLDEPIEAGEWLIRLPESVRIAIGERLDQLSDGCNELLKVAAVVGREFEVQLLERVTDYQAVELLELLEEAVVAQVVEEGESVGGYRFSHGLIQEALIEEMSTVQRVRLHSQVGEALEQLHADDLTPYYPELAHHFAESALAGNAEKAIDYAAKAGDQAMAGTAWESAINYYEKALELLDLAPGASNVTVHGDLLLSLADACWTVRDSERGESLALQAAELARSIDDPLRFAQAAQIYAHGKRLLGWGASNPNARVLIEEALSRIPDDDSLLHADLLRRWVLFSELRPETIEWRRQLAEEALVMAQRLGDSWTLINALHAQLFSYVVGEDCFSPEIIAKRSALSEQVSLLADELNAPGSIAWGGWIEGGWIDRFLLEPLNRQQRYERLSTFERAAHESRIPIIISYVPIFELMLLTLEGRFAEAEHVAKQVLPEAARPTDASEADTFSFVGQFLFMVYREQERLAEKFDDEVIHFMHAPGWETYWQVRLVLARIEVGQREQAQQQFEELARDDFVNLLPDWNWLENAATLGEIAYLLDDAERAAALYELLKPFTTYNAVMIRSWDFVGAVAYYLGLLATTLERWGDAEQRFEFALERHEKMELPPYIANTQHQYAAMLVRRCEDGDLDRARELNEQALEAAREMGMVRLERLATALAEKIEAAAQLVKGDDKHGLTPRELEVLALIVDGKPDREIAEDLYISPRTVMTHVSNILNKLGVTSRSAAAAYAAREGLV